MRPETNPAKPRPRTRVPAATFAAAIIIATGHATVAYIDFGDSTTTGTVGGVTYNDIAVDGSVGAGVAEVPLALNGGAATIAPLPLVDTDNGVTGWGLEIDSINTSGTIADNGSSWAGPYPSSLASIETSALHSMFYSNRNKQVQFTVSGLDNGEVYNILFYGAHDQTGTTTNSILTFAPVTGSGADFTSKTLNSYINTTDVLTWNAVSPEGGVISFSVQSGREGWLNFMSIEQVPEPSAAALAAIGLGILGTRRSRKRTR